MRSNKTIAESITGISYEEIKSLANNEAKSKFLGDQLRLTYVDGYKAGFDKGAEKMAKIKDAQIIKMIDHLDFDYPYFAAKQHKCIDLLKDIKEALENFRRSETFRKEVGNESQK